MARGDFQLKINGVLMPCPSTFDYGDQNVNAAESGRDDTGFMYTNEVCKKVKIGLGWNACTWETSSIVLGAIEPEYFEVTYPDPKRYFERFQKNADGSIKTDSNGNRLYKTYTDSNGVKHVDTSGCYTTKTFYVGDRSAPMKYWWHGKERFESLSFDIIER